MRSSLIGPRGLGARLPLGLLALAACVAARADVAPSITVVGEGTVDATPDLFILSIGVSHRDKDLDAARKEVGRRSGAIVKAIKAFPIDRARTFTSATGIHSVYHGESFLGYQVSQTIRFALNDIRQAEDFTVAVVKAGANRIDSMEFTVKAMADFEAQARRRAVADALMKAEGMAAELKHVPTDPLAITQDQGGFVLMGCRWDNVPLDAGTAALREEDRLHLIPPANAKINARVTVKFGLKKTEAKPIKC
jgi:hypothetical protein